jgi:hypothetical protein
LAMSICPEKAELWTSGEHERTEGFSSSGVRASACRTTAVQTCGCRQRAGTRRALVGTKARHHCKARERARRRRQRHLQSDRLSSMAGSQATAGLRGGASRQRATHHQRAHKARTRPRLEGRASQQERGLRLTLRSWTRRRGGGDEQRGMAWSRGSRVARSMASAVKSSLCSSPGSLAFRAGCASPRRLPRARRRGGDPGLPHFLLLLPLLPL